MPFEKQDISEEQKVFLSEKASGKLSIIIASLYCIRLTAYGLLSIAHCLLSVAYSLEFIGINA